MVLHTAFTEAYQKLNKRQREAVDVIEGPVMVIAGPGTGKTQILALRIAHILGTTDTPPDAILAISFTESAAAAMRARVVALVGDIGYRVQIYTFHSFCNALIQQYPEEFPDLAGASSVSDVERSRMLSAVIESGNFHLIRPFGNPTHYVRAMSNAIHILKRENVTPDAYASFAAQEEKEFLSRDDMYHTAGRYAGKMKGEAYTAQKNIHKQKELAEAYRLYEKSLRAQRAYDFDDMIMEVARAWRASEDFLRSVQERFLYFLIDEHQDTNNAQNAIIEALCDFDDRPNLFLVGDEKQAIFRFQGASFENFMRMKEKYPNMRLIVLDENYRSTQHILDASHGIGERIVKNPVRLRANVSYTPKPIRIETYENDKQELIGVVSRIRTHLTSGVDPDSIAILYRENKDAQTIAQALEHAGIPFVVESDYDVFSDPTVRALFALARAVDDPLDDESVTSVFHLPYLGVHPLDIYMIIRRAREHKRHILSYIKRLSEGVYTDEYEDRDAITRAYRIFTRWLRMRQVSSPLFLLDAIVRESGILTFTGNEANPESWRAIKRVYGELERVYERHTDYTFHDLVSYLFYMRAEGLSIRGNFAHTHRQAVRCMTVHRAKGLEFDFVYIVRAYDGHWGNKRVAELLPVLPRVYGPRAAAYAYTDEDRRLLYVAITRAKKEATISYARNGDDGRERLPAEYLSEIHDAVCIRTNVPHTSDSFLSIKPRRITNTADDHFIKTKHMIRELLRERGFSVTALNNYLVCPWRYFYVNLLGIPQVQKLHQLYGIAIHAALRDVAARGALLQDVHTAVSYAQERFVSYLRKKAIPAGEYERWLERGKNALRAYVGNFYEDILQATQSELRIEGISVVEDVVLRGIIDRVDITKDGTVRVVDYKTGKHKSAAHIEGKTKTSDGSIFRQLVFYKILLDAHKKGKYRMDRGMIVFVEPDEKGNCHAYEYVITSSHTAELKRTIQKTVREILDFSFWNKRCDDADCSYCEMRHTVRADE